MTVIALFESTLTAVSDVMLSVESIGNHIVMPSTGDVGALDVELDASPTRLVRKIFRFTHKGKVGVFMVAGTVSHISKLLSNMALVSSDPQNLNSRYSRILDSKFFSSVFNASCVLTEEEGLGDFEVIGVLDGEILSRLKNDIWRLDSVPYFGITHVAGSGALDLQNWLYCRGEQYENKFGLSSDCHETKAFRSLNLIPSMLLEEDTRISLRTIRNGVGGYYESYYVDPETLTLEPLDSVLTVFAAVVCGGEGPVLELRRVFYHRYISDWLIVISLFGLPVSLSLGKSLAIPTLNFERFNIPPLFEAGEPPELDSGCLIKEISTPENFRLTLYSEEAGVTPVLNRFSEGYGCRRLLNCVLSGDSVQISINSVEFDYYLERLKVTASSEGFVVTD